ncbi:fibrinogen-like YCDxxxxGGGW domain-containing protein [Polyangium aurulentum]|uniref:fibrinogen-like YCDxxxxGGGW domain-containing protein n=1 Tax=Polyangium aurulentum TaxID=2567896 RepID=UPI00197EF84E|nr:fibrinogen-like YCDxxxxGGGW domain-containing protein [Polyangium aurulentum]UQA61774.1 hypothetical protein E8A73_015400 [Polyangium aurulentum]
MSGNASAGEPCGPGSTSESCAIPAGGDCDEATGCYASCLDAHQRSPALPSGAYTIDIDGPGGLDPVQVYCDMVTDGGGWTRFWWSLDDSGDVSLDPLGEDLWSCDPTGSRCFGKIPLEVRPADFMVKDVNEGHWAAWHFDETNPVSSAALGAMRNHELACALDTGVDWMPYATNDDSGEKWCGVGSEEGGCDSFQYQHDGSCIEWKTGGWGLELDGDGGCYAAALKVSVGQEAFLPECGGPDNNFLDDGPTDGDDRSGELYYR